MTDHPSQPDADLPPKLIDDLRTAYGFGDAPQIPAEVDRRVAAAFGGRRSRWRTWGLGIAAAAAVVVTVGARVWFAAERSAPPAQVAYARTGDIRDAFYVARQLAAGEGPALGSGWDQNADGRVDQTDVRLLAMAAVKVGGGGVSP